MILFLDEERAYLYWATHHRGGFVLDCQRKPTKQHLTLHRSTCSAIKHSVSKKTHWTTGQHMKACSLDPGELRAWAAEQCGEEPADCPTCFAAASPAADQPVHLTKLDKEILDFVLEAAVLHLDDGLGAYWLSIGMVGKCLDKTPAQLSEALHRLITDGLLTATEPVLPGEVPSITCGLIPTVQAMRTLAIFQDRSDKEIKADIRALRAE